MIDWSRVVMERIKRREKYEIYLGEEFSMQ